VDEEKSQSFIFWSVSLRNVEQPSVRLLVQALEKEILNGVAHIESIFSSEDSTPRAIGLQL
jgi:hypothetical protein